MDLVRRAGFFVGISVALVSLGPLALAGQVGAPMQAAQGTPDGAHGVLASVTYGEFAPGKTIDATALGDSDLGLAPRQRFVEVLDRAGHAGHPDVAPAALSPVFETQVVSGRFPGDGCGLGRIKGGPAG